jgi:hypothetical protein
VYLPRLWPFLLDAREELLGAYWVGQTIRALKMRRLVIEPGIATRYCIEINQAFPCRRVRLVSLTPPCAIQLSASKGHKKQNPRLVAGGLFSASWVLKL